MNQIYNQCEQLDIFCLLPYTEDAQLVNKNQKLDNLCFLRSITGFAIKALDFFLEKDLNLFDAQVGENLCQIRAYKIISLAQKWLSTSVSKNKFSAEIERLKKYQIAIEGAICEWENHISKATAYNKNLDSTEPMGIFLTRNQLLYTIEHDFAFIIICYFLAYFNIRTNNMPVAINIDFIAAKFHISKYRAKNMKQKYQQLICKLGNDFIFTIAKELPTELGLKNISPNLYQILDEKKSVLPCYVVSEIIFHHSIKMQVPILLIVHQLIENNAQPAAEKYLYFLLKSKKDSSDFELVPTTEYLTQPCMVVYGETHYKNNFKESTPHFIERILSTGPLKLILANTAIHPQYAGNKLAAYQANPFLLIEPNALLENKAQEKRLIAMQKFALDFGCSQQNPSLFFLKHVYASTVQQEIESLRNAYQNSCIEAVSIINKTYDLRYSYGN